MEHYVTLFDSAFMAQGLALLASLRRHAGPFTLWVLAMDETVVRLLPQAGSEIRVIPLAEIETPAHLAVKPGRSKGEWCWTMTSSCFRAVFARDAAVERVTYLDADLYFLSSPAPLLADLERSGKHLLITGHHYDPELDQSNDCGKYCVQFITVVRADDALVVIDWWCERCMEWCFARFEPGRFGDQKYLDCWPTRFGSTVHVLNLPWAFTAPWNHRHLSGLKPAPVFHHFHGFRLVQGGRFLWWFRYHLGPGAAELYAEYQTEVERGIAWMAVNNCVAVRFPDPTAGGLVFRLRALYRRLTGFVHFGPGHGLG